MAKMKIGGTLEIDALNPSGAGTIPVSLTESRGKGVMLHVDVEFLKKARDGLNGTDGGWRGSWFHARGGFGDGGHLAIGRIEDMQCRDDSCRVILGDAQDEVSTNIAAGKLLRLLDEAFDELALLEEPEAGAENSGSSTFEECGGRMIAGEESAP